MGLMKRPYPKDWERRILVRTELAMHDMTVTDLSIALQVNRGNLTSVINGVRRSLKMERKIAAYFGKEREDLFPVRTPEELLEMKRGRDGGDGGAA
jgi:lambda repressor-like predicted transcriptional regulator